MDLIVGMGTRGKMVAERLRESGKPFQTWDLKEGPMMKSAQVFDTIYFCLPSSYTPALPVLLKSYKEDYKAKEGIEITLKNGYVVGREIKAATN